MDRWNSWVLAIIVGSSVPVILFVAAFIGSDVSAKSQALGGLLGGVIGAGGAAAAVYINIEKQKTAETLRIRRAIEIEIKYISQDSTIIKNSILGYIKYYAPPDHQKSHYDALKNSSKFHDPIFIPTIFGNIGLTDIGEDVLRLMYMIKNHNNIVDQIALSVDEPLGKGTALIRLKQCEHHLDLISELCVKLLKNIGNVLVEL